MKRLRAWWPRTPRPGNLGDVLTPVVLAGLGYDAKWVGQSSADVLATGSIIRFAGPGQTVFGSGAMWAKDRPSPRARYLAVRGPLTRGCVLAAGGGCPEVCGDPALLLPKFVTEPVQRVYDIGLVPHYVDRASVAGAHPDEHIIDVLRADPLEVVHEIRQCSAIVSSSLHGIIVAHAFGVPAAWVRWSGRLTGDDVKFRDYALSVGVRLRPHASLSEALDCLVCPEPEMLDEVRARLIEAARGLG